MSIAQEMKINELEMRVAELELAVAALITRHVSGETPDVAAKELIGVRRGPGRPARVSNG